MDLIEIEQHKLIVEKGKELLKVCFKSDFYYMQNVINKSKKIIDAYNSENLTIIDLTKKEYGLWRSTVKKIVWFKYYKKATEKLKVDDDFIPCENHKELFIYNDGEEEWFYNEEKYCDSCKKEQFKIDEEIKNSYKKQNKIRDECKKACRKTIFSEDLMLKYILLIRKGQDKNDQEPLLLAIKSTIRTEILKTFQEQNQKSITKYI